MSGSIHTYGPTCRLSHSVNSPDLGKSDSPPKIKTQFFYSSPLPIDDPLTVIPTPTSSDAKINKLPLRPFSVYDNAALEEAWLKTFPESHPKEHQNCSSLTSECRPGHHDHVGTVEADKPRIDENICHGKSEGEERPQGLIAGRLPISRLGDSRWKSPEPLGLHKTRAALRDDMGKLRTNSSRRFDSGVDHDAMGPKSSITRSETCEGTVVPCDVPVGISRLHLVKLPSLQMMPIYWSPVHDIAAVTRATWFYGDTMLPVEPVVANQLESGYLHLRPWSQTWKDELDSAVEVGAAGEEKLAYDLWSKENRPRNRSGSIQQMQACAHQPCYNPGLPLSQTATAGFINSDKVDQEPLQVKDFVQKYSNSRVIYKDIHNAFLLKPTLQPSDYYGRRPVAKIKRGTTVGIHVVRGFDWKAWQKLHPSKIKTDLQAAAGKHVATDAASNKNIGCVACREKDERPPVTDLILVIHGIGQKLSERIESFHFTHAINAFRRSVNVEFANNHVRNLLRDDLGGVMVLPVNWRSNLTFEDGSLLGFSNDGKASNRATNEFSLKDITPDSIPAVRNLISDVMLDIPYYMSHHKPRMIRALVNEANRVFRLWCKNNPEFLREGNVHIIAHSLGSAMALDILSHQPTSVGSLDPKHEIPRSEFFEFDTRNLFFVGSPVGFFLLLEKGKLVPRRGRSKPGADLTDINNKDIVGEVGSLGCLAVDNIYNVMALTDPVAYRLNATVDAVHAASLKTAHLPSVASSWLNSFTSGFQGRVSGAAINTELGVSQVTKPNVARLPSQLEMDVHDFTHEEIAEKKFTLLNDNGQIDYLLRSGGGPLEIQYLNMLSAHSSYWGNPDFVRMLVLEIGRKPGKSNILPLMRAVKTSAGSRARYHT